MQGDHVRRNALSRSARVLLVVGGALGVAVLLAALPAPAPPSPQTAAAEAPDIDALLGAMVPHHALYDMTMLRVRPGRGVVGVSGRMYMEWADACDGWRIEQRIVMRLSHGDGNELTTDSYFKSWESKDGTQLRFDLKTQRDGTLEEELSGNARLRSEAEGGIATYRKPGTKEVELPPGTVFPTAHTVLIAHAIKSGSSFLSRVIFDGGSEDNPLLISAAIGGQLPPLENATDATHGPGERNAWPVAMAFYKLDDLEGLPLYEITIHFQGNGVARRMDLDYGEFAVRARLVGFERIPAPKC